MAIKTTVVTIHSRNGGTGKTSVALLAAIQLAAAGRKVALVELSFQGSHLAESLALDFPQIPGIDPYRRPCLIWHHTGNPLGKPIPAVRKLSYPLGLSPTLLEQQFPPIRQALAHLRDHLHIFATSGFIADTDAVHRSVLQSDGQARYRRFLDGSIAHLEGLGYEYILIDNDPGLSFLPGVTLAAFLQELGEVEQRRRLRAWFIAPQPIALVSLLMYELSVYSHLTPKRPSTIVVNRVKGDWHGLTSGERLVATEEATSDEAVPPIIRDLFMTRLWSRVNTPLAPLYNELWVETGFSLAVLGEAPLPLVSDGTQCGGETLLNQLVYALTDKNPFHIGVLKALVDPLLSSEEER